MIDKFRGEYFFLSNFYPCKVVFDGLTYSCSESAYQAQKTLDKSERERISKMNADESKKEGRKLQLRNDWEDVKLDIMYQICKAKFFQNKDLMIKLAKTDEEVLVEGNDWNDTYWGVCDGIGENNLGKILMKIRDEILGYEARNVGLNATFSHKCTRCGNCCKKRGDIILTPYDVLAIAQHLGVTTLDVINRYCYKEPNGYNIAIKAEGKEKKCVFLKYSKAEKITFCQIYDARPAACYLFPLGFGNGYNTFNIHIDPNCITEGQKTVNQHLKVFGQRYKDDYINAVNWCAITNLIKEEQWPPEKIKEFFDYFFNNQTKEELDEKISKYV